MLSEINVAYMQDIENADNDQWRGMLREALDDVRLFQTQSKAMQDKITKALKRWTPLYERYCDPKHPDKCECDWCEIDRAIQETEK